MVRFPSGGRVVDELDGCDVDMTDPAHITQDDDIAALVLFADCWDDPEAVEQRKAEWAELFSA